MKPRRRRVVFVLAAVVPVAGIAGIACGISARGQHGGDATRPPDDGGPDDTTARDANDPLADAGGEDDGATAVDGGGDADADLDAGVDAPIDGALPFLYDCEGAGAVVSCKLCADRPIACIHCKAGDGTFKGTCIAETKSCYTEAPPGYGVCTCPALDAAACPLFADQACNDFAGGYCQPCGDDLSDGYPCKGGGTCDEKKSNCK